MRGRRRDPSASADMSDSLPFLLVRPANLQVPQNPPEQPAVHAAGDAAACLGLEGLGLGVFEVVGHLVEEGVEKLLHRAPAEDAVVCVDADQALTVIVATQDVNRRSL